MEEWRDIPGFPGFQVSNFGEVKSTEKLLPHRRGGLRVKKEYLLKKFIRSHGYYVVNTRKNKKVSQQTVHSLVALAFLGPRPPGYDVCHNDGNRLNNRVDNLRYDSRKSNIADSIIHGTFGLGEKHYARKLTEAEVRLIREKHENGISISDMTKEFGVSYGAIDGIIRGSNWKHLK